MHSIVQPSLAAIFFSFLTLFLFVVGRNLIQLKVRGPRLPPGPKPKFFIGNITDLPNSHEWLRLTEWSKTYGDVVYVHVFGQPLVILGTVKAAKDLLEARGSLYSCRPRFPMIYELMGWDWAVQFMPYGARFKKFRKSVQSTLHQQAILRYRKVIETSTEELLEAILVNPSAFMDHIAHGVASLMISVIYGVEDKESRDQFIRIADDAIEGLVAAGNIGTFLVDLVPLLKYIPEWFPGAHFQTKARRWRELSRNMIDIPFENVTKTSHADSVSSVVNNMLSQAQYMVDPELIKGTAGVLYLGGADTQLSLLYSFVLMMILHPEIQKRAQTEVDQVVGKGGKLSFDDKKSLMYLNCIYLETLRWYPVVPLGVPHRAMETDYYKGFKIPRGSTVLVNQWTIFRDENNYKDAANFNPDRFLHQDDPSKAILDPRTVAFGFGRRRCPGQLFAEDTTWMIMASLLHKFTITSSEDDCDPPIVPENLYCSSIISRPGAFKADFKVRE